MAPASLLTLSNELLYKICKNLCPHCADFLRYLPRNYYIIEDGRSALFYLSKTCRRLREIAQPILYHRVSTGRHWHFLRSIIARPDLAVHVRQFRDPGNSGSHFQRDFDAHAVLRLQKELLRHMAGIHEIDIISIDRANVLELILARLPNGEELSINIQTTHTKVFHVQITSIRRLRLFSYIGDTKNRDQMGGLLSVMPHVEDLTISMDFQPKETYTLPVTELRSLDLGHSAWNVLGLTTVINRCPKLERFRYRGEIGHDLFGDNLTWPRTQRILRRRRRTLKHVRFSHGARIYMYPEQSPLSHFGSFRKLVGLETLWMDIGDILPDRCSPNAPSCPANTTEMVDFLPESLRLVYICGLTRRWHGIEMLAQAIEGGHFPRLETVVVAQSGATLRESRRALAAVGVACESIMDAIGDGRHLFPEGGFWDNCYWG